MLSNRNNTNNTQFHYWQEVFLLFVSVSQSTWRWYVGQGKNMLSDNSLQFSDGSNTEKNHAGATPFKVELFLNTEPAQ